MKLGQRRTFFFVGVYIFITVLSLGGLTLNIKAFHLNELRVAMTHDIEQLKKENQRLETELLSQISLDNIDKKAGELGLVKPSHVIYLPLVGAK